MICVMFSSTALIRYSSAPYTSQIAWTALHCWEMLCAIFHRFVLYFVVLHGFTRFCTVLHPRNMLSSSAQYGTEWALVADLIGDPAPQNFPFNVAQILHWTPLYFSITFFVCEFCRVICFEAKGGQNWLKHFPSSGQYWEMATKRVQKSV